MIRIKQDLLHNGDIMDTQKLQNLQTVKNLKNVTGI